MAEAARAAGPDDGATVLRVDRLPPSEAEGELRELLHRRLTLLNRILLVPPLAIAVTLHLDALHRAEVTWVTFLFFYTLAALFLGSLLALRRPGLTLRALRGVEAYLFGCAGAGLALAQYLWLESGWLDGIALPGQARKVMQLSADSLSYPWSLLILMYGVVIPNTGRRCMRAVLLMAAAALLVTALAGRRGDELGYLVYRVVLGKMAGSLAVTGAFAVYGSHRLSTLQHEAQAARRLGQYALKERLGAGGMGEVYLAEHQLLKRPCAVKLIRTDRTGDTATLLRFQREVQATAALTHPNVVEIFDYGRAHDGTFYYVMEYLPGLSLAELIQRFGPLPPARVVHLLRQVCGALAEAHARGLIHRDIKPSNLLVCERGGVHDVVKLLDFGLVQEADRLRASLRLSVAAGGPPTDDPRASLTRPGLIVGTPQYMSPEQVGGERKLDGRSDLYSLGAVAYCLLAGHPPFHGLGPFEVMAAHRSEPVTPLLRVQPAVPVDLHGVVMRCLEKAPADRFPDARTLERTLARCDCAGLWTEEQAEQWWRRLPPAALP